MSKVVWLPDHIWFSELHFVLFFETFNVFNKEDEMFKFFILLALTTIVCLQSFPAYCETLTLQISVTIPAHAILSNDSQVSAFANNAQQLVQTQTVIRNNQSVQINSIVVP